MEKFPSVVGDVMSAPAINVDGETNVRDSAILMTEKGIGSLVVMERGKVIGVVTKRDMMQRVVTLCLDPCETRIKDIMSSPIITVSKEMGILAAMRKMREHKISHLVVMEGNKLEGIISERDVLRAVSYASLASFRPLIRDAD
ncbi:MAG: CBS domain-containing protein [Candidatus Bathyarchaeota archaeon]|jgi:CBS domain-containing protein